MAVTSQSAPAPPAYGLVVTGVRGHRVCIRASGVLGLAAEDELTRVLGAEIDGGRSLLHLDLSDATHVGGCCLRVFVAVHERCLAAHGLLLLDALPDGLVQVFTVPGLERRLFLTASRVPVQRQPEPDGIADLVRVERERSDGVSDWRAPSRVTPAREATREARRAEQ